MSLKISNLSKQQNDQWILRDVSFEVGGGEIFGLIGENGAEKSAVLQLLSGAEAINSGEISFNGNNLPKNRIVHFPPIEGPNLLQKLFLQTAKAGVYESDKIISDFENTLNTADSLLLLNNPFCCLNENLRDELLENLRTTARKKKLAVVLTTNDYEEVFAACDRVGVLKNGEIVQIGTPRELYEHPNSVATAAALGRYNFIKAMRISFNNQGSQEFQTLKGEHRLQTDKTEKRSLGAINAPITLAIRPEHISISFGASFPEDNLIRAKIVDVQYRGATTRVILDANGLILEALVLRLVGLKIGDECMVGLSPDRIQVLKD